MRYSEVADLNARIPVIFGEFGVNTGIPVSFSKLGSVNTGIVMFSMS